jgi:hypothetical protein
MTTLNGKFVISCSSTVELLKENQLHGLPAQNIITPQFTSSTVP